MYGAIPDLMSSGKKLTLILNNGFEDRAPRAVEVLKEQGSPVHRVFLLKYAGHEHEDSYRRVRSAAQQILTENGLYVEADVFNGDTFDEFVEAPKREEHLIACDVTGLARSLMLKVLSRLYRHGAQFGILYTEAAEYYPRLADFQGFLAYTDPSEAFARLAEYEEAEVVYSADCSVEDIPELPGQMFPNHPLLLVGFLTFKRSRLGAVLREYETNLRILIKARPVREDLAWRLQALEIINFDLLDGSVIELPTLDWKETYRYLQRALDTEHRRYRYNVILAPLGGKMQTLGAWYFAATNPAVKVVTSTPRKLFPRRFSTGFRTTHWIDMTSYTEQVHA